MKRVSQNDLQKMYEAPSSDLEERIHQTIASLPVQVQEGKAVKRKWFMSAVLALVLILAVGAIGLAGSGIFGNRTVDFDGNITESEGVTDVQVQELRAEFTDLDKLLEIVPDGEYGIVIYNKSADVSGYTEKETILHVTGSISIYNGLYEIGSPVVTVASSVPEENVPATPVVYATAGGETADKASRLTTVTGTPTLTSGSFDDDAGTNDIKMNFNLGADKIVQVFYKKAAQTADAETFAAIKAAVEGSAEITIKGFTGWYNGFQVQMNGYVPPAEGYTAEVFAQDLLDQTDTVCKDYDGVTDNHDAIEAIWSDLASNDKYPSLPSAEKTILAEAARDESGTVVEQAMARYDYLTGKYNLSNFINGRTPVSFEAHITTISSEANTTNAMIIVTVIALTSVSAIAVLLVIKRRKTY